MQFRTVYTPVQTDFVLNPQNPVVMLGSCFSDNITERMRSSLWDASNPLGTLYNPLSISNALEIFLFAKDFHECFRRSLFIDTQGKCRSFFGDFRLAADNEEEAMEKAEQARGVLFDKLKKADALFVTFGTSICYSLRGDEKCGNLSSLIQRERKEILDSTVANCHKLPSSRFEKFRLSIDEITDIWIRMSKKLKHTFPELKIVFTVSPVRHLKDGFIANSRSKSILLLAIEEICSRIDYCYYFPAYEILNDDLRDYRFYASDLAHPSESAVEYIWEIFKATYLDNRSQALLEEGVKILKAIKHRPLLMNYQEQAEYKSKVRERYDAFISRYPGMLKMDS